MSQVDLLLSPKAAGLPPAEDTYVAKEPSGEQLVNDADKQPKSVIENGNHVESVNERENVKPSNSNANHRHPNKSLPNNGKAKKHRRGKKRKWKPYSKLSWSERKALQDREERRAEKVRADMCASGLTLAPYNTTQFLMDDHKLREPAYEYIPSSTKVNYHNHHAKENHPQNGATNGTHDSSDEFYSSPEDEEDFLQQQFTETYRSFHAERLNSMSHEELVQEVMSLEDKAESLQKAVNNTNPYPHSSTDLAKHEEQLEKIRVFEVEIRKLTELNERLRQENEELRLTLQACGKQSE